MSLSKVRSALVKAFTDGAFIATEKVAFENMAFETPASGAWASFHFIPNTPEVATLGAGGRDECRGFVQVDLNFPTGSGDKAAGDMADTIKNVFKAGARFAYSGQEVIIRSVGRSQGRVVNNFYRVSITINFYAQLIR
jgi:hypothetical protein